MYTDKREKKIEETDTMGRPFKFDTIKDQIGIDSLIFTAD